MNIHIHFKIITTFMFVILIDFSPNEAINSSKISLNDKFIILSKTTQTMHRSLSYLSRIKQYQSVDSLFGVKIVKDQSESLIKLINYISQPLLHCKIQQLIVNQTKHSLIQLNRHSNFIMQTSIGNAFQNDPSYFRATSKLLSNQIWSKIELKAKYLHMKLLNDSDRSTNLGDCMQINETVSDNCLVELFRGCQISPRCWSLFGIATCRQYRLSHQVLYLSVANSMNCQRKLALTTNKLWPFESKIESMCASIYRANLQIETNHFANQDQDLFMENIVFCGYNGFRQFRNNLQWLDRINEWQNQTIGCYMVDLSLLKEYLRQHTGHRIKRRETVFQNGCSLHKTSIALASMAIYVQQLIVDIITQIGIHKEANCIDSTNSD